jgi:hypothetical protein
VVPDRFGQMSSRKTLCRQPVQAGAFCSYDPGDEA